jgi:hypothetical protein
MNLVKSLQQLFSGGSGASAHHKRGMAKAKREDWAGAVLDYTAAIDSSNVSDDLKAMALFNRALAQSHLGQQDQAHADLHAALAIPDAPANIKMAAKEKLARWEKRQGR